MTQAMHLPILEAFNQMAQDMTLAGLKAEMDGLAAMFSVLSASGLLPATMGLVAAERPHQPRDFDNLPV